MRLRTVFLAIFFLALTNSGASEVALECYFREVGGRYAWTLVNKSSIDVLILDLRNSIDMATGNEVNAFMRGKEWTRLRATGSPFGTDEITFAHVEAMNPSKHRDGTLTVRLRVAVFDTATSKVGEWKPVTVVFRELEAVVPNDE